jgi:hypothetical protein
VKKSLAGLMFKTRPANESLECLYSILALQFYGKMVQDKNAKNGKRSPSCDKNHISDHLILQMVIQRRCCSFQGLPMNDNLSVKCMHNYTNANDTITKMKVWLWLIHKSPTCSLFSAYRDPGLLTTEVFLEFHKQPDSTHMR